MKKAMFLAVLAVLAVSLFGWVAPVLAQDSEENFKGAGQKILAEKEQILLGKKTAIEAFVLQSIADRVATGEEMIALNGMVDDFIKIKAEADDYLRFYNLATKTDLEPGLVDATKNYYDHDGFFRDDDGGKARYYFTRVSGNDIVVERSGIEIAGGQIAMMFLLSALLFFSIMALARIKEESNRFEYATFAAVCILFFLFLTIMLLLF